MFGFFRSAMQRRFEWCDLSEVPFLKSDPGRGGAAGYPGQNHPRRGDGSRSLRVSPGFRSDCQSPPRSARRFALLRLLPLSRQGWKGSTPLHVAVMYGKAELIPILLAAGADVNAKASACASLPRCPPSGWRPANAALRSASGGSGSTVAINRGASSRVPSRWRAQVRGAISVD